MEKTKRFHHRSQLTQMPIYLGKFFRMFFYQDDWKVIPMSAVIAGLVAMVIRRTMFVNMEGTLKGALAIACVCIWNGCFNSIQVVCRERSIVKREHRSGMLITSYLMSHMIYQGFLCVLQTITMYFILMISGMQFPEHGILFSNFILEFLFSLLLITYAADMLSLLISCIARTTTAAMTLMPFVLIFQLIFSGGVFVLPESMKPLSNLSIAKWGVTCLASQAHYNELPMEMGWTIVGKFKDAEFEGQKPVQVLIDTVGEEKVKEQVMMAMAEKSRMPAYESTVDNIKNCWMYLILFSLIEAALSMLILKNIDKDKR